ncbi:MAG TPA: hypothetical protein EYG11_15360 [Candidatus Latescibacteria bacterium]|nr:hypothetical protein [Candidatus Handelsmanbacteria bacterium]HIL10078.1 hypothetical protein [Candidatus Latescibacterota bacterium]
MNFRLCALLSLAILAACGTDASKNAEAPGGGPLPLPLPLRNRPPSGPLALAADLDGRYVQSIRIEEGEFTATGPGQEVAMTFAANGMAKVKQFEFRLEIDPVEALDFAESAFVATQPFLQPPPSGTELGDDGQWRIAGVILGDSQAEGDNTLGTLTFKTKEGFDAGTQVQVRITFFSVGPSFSDRDDYTANDLNMGITINK